MMHDYEKLEARRAELAKQLDYFEERFMEHQFNTGHFDQIASANYKKLVEEHNSIVSILRKKSTDDFLDFLETSSKEVEKKSEEEAAKDESDEVPF